MIRLPFRSDGQWTVTHNSDKLPDIFSTRNLTLDKEGYIRLSKPVVSFYTESDDADFMTPIGIIQGTEPGEYIIATEDAVFELDMYNSGNYGTATITQDATANTPLLTGKYGDTSYYNQDWLVMNPVDQKLYECVTPYSVGIGAWNVRDVSATLEAADYHAICHFVSQNTIAVGNDNQVDQYNTGFAAGQQLQLPGDFTVTGLAYNNSLIGITTHHKSNTQLCMFYVWDGETAAANYVAEVPSISSYSPVAYKGTFVFLAGDGGLYYWTPTGLEMLTKLPVYFTDALLASGLSSGTKNHGIVVEGDLIHINLKSQTASADTSGQHYLPEQPGGVWTYDPAVGLYHRHAPTGTKLVVDVVATADVNTTDDEITVTAAYPSGTPVRYSDVGGTAIAELTSGTVYYTIYVDATTIKLATTYARAIAGTAIDLTGTGNDNQTLQFYLKRDFGQSYLAGEQGVILLENQRPIGADLYYQNFFFGGNCAINGTTEYASGCFALKDTENRGHFVTGKFLSPRLKDDWKKLYIKHSNLETTLDTIVVKYRIKDDGLIVKIKDSNSGAITWSDENTFTTTDAQFANVIKGDEVEIIQGSGSGYLAHVSSISESTGTYTVNLDESIKNLTAAETGRVIVYRWKKLATITSSTPTNDDGYSEIGIGKKSKMIQFKVELRGEDVEVEELLLDNEASNPV